MQPKTTRHVTTKLGRCIVHTKSWPPISFEFRSVNVKVARSISVPIFHPLIPLNTCSTRKRGRAQRKGRPLLPPSECYWLANATPTNYRHVARFSLGLIYGPIFSPFVDGSSPDYVSRRGRDRSLQRLFRLSISCSVPEIFAIEMQSRPKSHQKARFRPHIFWGKTTPNSDHVAKFRGDRRWRKKERKKETAAKHKGRSRVRYRNRRRLAALITSWYCKKCLVFACRFTHFLWGPKVKCQGRREFALFWVP